MVTASDNKNRYHQRSTTNAVVFHSDASSIEYGSMMLITRPSKNAYLIKNVISFLEID